jgi:hypothetical protein
MPMRKTQGGSFYYILVRLWWLYVSYVKHVSMVL